MEKTRTLFVGTSEFAVPILEKLLQLEFVELTGVVTQPDKPVGRHHSDLQPSAVGKTTTQIKGIEIFKPEKLAEEAESILESTQPELIIVASYGQMIPKSMLEYPRYSCINVHASLLPKLRGAVPIPMAILNGLEETGVTFQRMVEKLDAGDIISAYEVEIDSDETTESLTKKLSNLAAKKLEEVLKGWIEGELEPVVQNEQEATFCSQKDIAKSNAQILADTDIKKAERMIRAFYPWPVAWGLINVNGTQKRLKIFTVNIVDIEDADIDISSNSILALIRRDDKLLLQLDSGTLELLEIQLEGKERKPVSEYLFLGSN